MIMPMIGPKLFSMLDRWVGGKWVHSSLQCMSMWGLLRSSSSYLLGFGYLWGCEKSPVLVVCCASKRTRKLRWQKKLETFSSCEGGVGVGK